MDSILLLSSVDYKIVNGSYGSHLILNSLCCLFRNLLLKIKIFKYTVIAFVWIVLLTADCCISIIFELEPKAISHWKFINYVLRTCSTNYRLQSQWSLVLFCYRWALNHFSDNITMYRFLYAKFVLQLDHWSKTLFLRNFCQASVWNVSNINVDNAMIH